MDKLIENDESSTADASPSSSSNVGLNNNNENSSNNADANSPVDVGPSAPVPAGKTTRSSAKYGRNNDSSTPDTSSPRNVDGHQKDHSNNNRRGRLEIDSELTTETTTKKSKKDGHSADVSATSGALPTPLTTVFAGGFPASSYLQGLSNLSNPYAGLFGAADAAAVAGNAFLGGAQPFAFNAPSVNVGSAETSAKDGGLNHAFNGNTALINALNQMDVSAVRQLINGYREAAALLMRTSNELEAFLGSKK